ncbi:MAG: ribulose-phosphate 3-epimerase [Clostridia bacterium]
MSRIFVSPSILSADFSEMKKSVRKLKKWKADFVHCDVMDGAFVENITFGMPMIKAIRPHTELPLDVHLMINSPEKYVQRFIDAGADFITFHAETCADVDATLDLIKGQGKLCGLVLNPDIAVSIIAQYLDKLDIVMIMGVYPGFGAQKLIEDTIVKVKELADLIGDRNIWIEFDGGVTLHNVGRLVENGVNVVVAGSCIYSAKCPKSAVKAIHNYGKED